MSRALEEFLKKRKAIRASAGVNSQIDKLLALNELVSNVEEMLRISPVLDEILEVLHRSAVVNGDKDALTQVELLLFKIKRDGVR